MSPTIAKQPPRTRWGKFAYAFFGLFVTFWVFGIVSQVEFIAPFNILLPALLAAFAGGWFWASYPWKWTWEILARRR